MTGYRYGGTNKSMSDEEVAAHLARARATAAARANGASTAPPTQPERALKGAVKVERFPEKSKYPFRQIADDGGVWRLDPAAFKVTAGAIKQAAPKWAQNHGLAVKCVEDDGQVYVQFRKDGA